MSGFFRFIDSSVGKKIVMALTGLFIILFLVEHLAGNLLLLLNDNGKIFEEYSAFMAGSLNIPVFMLRLKADTLDPAKKYILYCDTGRRSSAGAFLLSERGFQAYCLKGGLQARAG